MPPIVITTSGEGLITLTVGKRAPEVAHRLRATKLDGVLDVVPCFDAVGVYFEPESTAQEQVQAWLDGFEPHSDALGFRHHVVPVCYALGPDLAGVCRDLNVTEDAFVRAHTQGAHTCEAIGFCPGFPYLSGLPSELAGLPRKDTPLPRVPAGTVAVMGPLTGIYTLDRPGGWWLVGQTPLCLVDPADDYFPLTVGDTVSLVAITAGEFDQRRGERL